MLTTVILVFIVAMLAATPIVRYAEKMDLSDVIFKRQFFKRQFG
ncbi:MAG: hypothetical protein ACE5IJ_00500 [Thermoplasmata archaeon]